MSLTSKDPKYKEPGEYSAARRLIMQIANQLPQINARQIAGMSDLEQLGLGMAGQFMNERPGEYQAAIDALLNSFGNAQNIFDIPEYKALYETMSGDMTDELNSIGRSLQLSGNTSSSTGASVLGKSLGNLKARLMGSMAPYAQDLMNKRYNAPMQAANIAGMRDADTQNRIQFGMQAGSLQRALEQLGNDARYEAEMFNVTAPFEYQIPAASAVFGSGGQWVDPGGAKGWVKDLATIGGMFDV